MTFDAFADANRAEAEQFPGREGELEAERAALPAGQALRLPYAIRLAAEGAERRVATLQYALLGASRGYVVTFSTLPGLRDRYAMTFDRSIETFEISN